MSLYAVSDLHITSSEDPLYRSLLELLGVRLRAGDTAVLAGDVFDLFVGGKRVFTERYRRFFEEVAGAAARGAEIHYIEGNHDFLMRRAFGSESPVKLHSSELSLEVGGKRFFFAHGDTVDRADYRYRTLRAVFRSPAMKALVRAVPGPWVDGIGGWSSRRSRAAKPELPTSEVERLRKLYRGYAAERVAQGYDYVILGHCHDLDETTLRSGERKGQYVNVGYPRIHGSFLAWSPGDERIRRERMPGY